MFMKASGSSSSWGVTARAPDTPPDVTAAAPDLLPALVLSLPGEVISESSCEELDEGFFSGIARWGLDAGMLCEDFVVDRDRIPLTTRTLDFPTLHMVLTSLLPLLWRFYRSLHETKGP